MAEKKSKAEKLSETLLSNKKSLGEIDAGLLAESIEFCEGYKQFLSCKTEREVVDYVLPILKKNKYNILTVE